ncbi:MAG: hypothetical protein JHC93_06070 [Parachlamydiales bacterium]|nr:hypothetical protein [Parachlamydiales bacterium]
MSQEILETSTLVKEGVLHSSKWIELPTLLDIEEMRDLLNQLGPYHLYRTDCLVENGAISTEDFLNSYANYIKCIKNKQPIEEAKFKQIFNLAITVDLQALYRIEIHDKEIVKCRLPVIRMQPHRFNYSTSDQKFRSMVLGNHSISWGVQFSYPQIFQDPKTHSLQKVGLQDPFFNTAYFRALQKWIRYHTLPTPFLVDGKRTNAPIRIGKNCFNWVNNHPQLELMGISVII